jgi:AhpD family alkylhydroperoxidase
MATPTMQARIPNIALAMPEVLTGLQRVSRAASATGLSPQLTELVALRASQINGCSLCVDLHTRALKEAGETHERLFASAAWRDSPYFDEAERAALDLAEYGTRLCDRPDPVPDEVWEEAARHFSETELAGLVVAIASINAWNRLNIITRQVAGAGDWS